MPQLQLEPLDSKIQSILDTLLAPKNAVPGGTSGGEQTVQAMQESLQILGISLEQLATLRIIHVTGTKGKGSTCAMVESMLRQAGYKTGTYTSPHLVDVRERIRVNGEMVSKELFEEHFWSCHNQLSVHIMPWAHSKRWYFMFLTLLAFRLYLSQNLDVVVVEVGIGGRRSATNVIPSPVACGITSIWLDHMEVLGNTLQLIAREKAGILRKGVPGFTVTQEQEAMASLQEVAQALGAPLRVTDTLDKWRMEDGSPCLNISLGGKHQLQNAGVAVELCKAFEEDCLSKGIDTTGAEQRVAALRQRQLPAQYVRGMQLTYWPGRSQVIYDEAFVPVPVTPGSGAGAAPVTSRLTFFLDGAHTAESLAACAEWFADAVNTQPMAPGVSRTERVLLFNCMKKRDPTTLLPALVSHCSLNHALFVPFDTQVGPQDTPGKVTVSNGTGAVVVLPDLSWQVKLQQLWHKMCEDPNNYSKMVQPVESKRDTSVPLLAIPGLPAQVSSKGAVLPSLSDAVDWLRCTVRCQPELQLHVLVTGSLYLVGDMLRLLGRPPV